MKKVLYIAPDTYPGAGGNRITLERWREGMKRKGIGTGLLPVSPEEDPDRIDRAAENLRPDVVHVYHAWRAGRPFLKTRTADSHRWVVHLAGTDWHEFRKGSGTGKTVTDVLDRAAAVTTHSPSMAREILRERPDWGRKTTVLPKGALLPQLPYLLSRPYARPRILFAGGIREVKQPLEAVRLLERVREKVKTLQLFFAGPVQEEETGRRWREEISRRSWVHDLDVVPHSQIASLLVQMDVVVNCSRSEGMSNTLIEAMRYARPVVASDIPGNRDVIEDGKTGLLYKTDREFLEKMEHLLTDDDFRHRLAESTLTHARSHFSPEAEWTALLNLYENGVPSVKGRNPETQDRSN